MKPKAPNTTLKHYYKGNDKITSGLRKTRFWQTFNNLKRRCYSPKNNRYYAYGARGIKCEWKTFREFVDDMYESYLIHCKKFGEHNTQIDRKNGDDNYCKKNCQWVTLIEQARNKKNTILIDFKGKLVGLREWSILNGLDYKTVFYRYKYKKEPTDKILIYLKNKQKCQN